MKKSFRLSGVLFLITIYCFAITVISLPVKFGTSNSQSEKEQYLYSASTDFHVNTSQLEKLIDSIYNLHTLSLKKSVNEFCLIVKTVEQLIRTEYVQYFKFSTNFLIEYKKSKLIFPFHYFW